MNLIKTLKEFFQPTTTIKEEVIEVIKEEKNRDYLVDLLEKVNIIKEQNLITAFYTTKVWKQSFQAKTNGLYATIPFRAMPWQYEKNQYWHYVAPFLYKKVFVCTIEEIEGEKNIIKLNAQKNIFKPAPLLVDKIYKGIIVEKSISYILIEIGVHFDWSYGSMVGLMHKTSFWDQENFEKVQAGEIINTTFHGFREENKIMLGDEIPNRDWINGKYDKYIGSTQLVKAHRTGEKKVKFSLFEEQHNGRIPATKLYYPKTKRQVKTHIENLQDGQIVECIIVGTEVKMACFILQLTENYLIKNKIIA